MNETSALNLPASVDAVIELLATEGYICDRRLATAMFLSLTLHRPLFLEGEPGVGKTELGKTLARCLATTLLRVQCYEGLDVAQTAYEWNVARQMIEIRLAEAAHDVDRAALVKNLYAREMLIERADDLAHERVDLELADLVTHERDDLVATLEDGVRGAGQILHALVERATAPAHLGDARALDGLLHVGLARDRERRERLQIDWTERVDLTAAHDGLERQRRDRIDVGAVRRGAVVLAHLAHGAPV